VLSNIGMGQVLDEFHPVPATTEVDEADLVGEGSVKHVRQSRVAALLKGDVVER
jgi:hypothetical protein